MMKSKVSFNFRSKKIVLIIAIFMILLLLSYTIYHTFSTVPKLFRLNNALAGEGYYTAEFEFKMLTFAYDLDHGHYLKAYRGINQLYSEMKNKTELIKVPGFKTAEEEYAFYLNMQNPKTGAFMDDSYPVFTYFEPTMNVIEKLESLSEELGRPLELKYSLNFLDDISTKDELTQYLDGLSTVGWIGTKFKTPYILAAKLTGYKKLEDLNLYSFSDEWENTLTEWFYRHQDKKTGMWGPRMRSNDELYDSGDLGCTYIIIQNLFSDENGQSLNTQYPLRYTDAIFQTSLMKISEPVPDDANLDETHDWTIRNYQGIKLLTHYLWKTASDDNKGKARDYIKSIVISDFEHTYVDSDGAFSLYPDTGKADLDGTSTMFHLLSVIGAFDPETQKLIWGTSIKDYGTIETSELTAGNLDPIIKSNVNSIRIYKTDTTNYLHDVSMVFYAEKPVVPDAADLVPKLSEWIHSTDLSLGTWASKEVIQGELSDLDTHQTTVITATFPTEMLNEMLRSNGSLYLIGFDKLQIPQCRMIIKYID